MENEIKKSRELLDSILEEDILPKASIDYNDIYSEEIVKKDIGNINKLITNPDFRNFYYGLREEEKMGIIAASFYNRNEKFKEMFNTMWNDIPDVIDKTPSDDDVLNKTR